MGVDGGPASQLAGKHQKSPNEGKISIHVTFLRILIVLTLFRVNRQAELFGSEGELFDWNNKLFSMGIQIVINCQFIVESEGRCGLFSILNFS